MSAGLEADMSVILPTYNEAENIGSLIETLTSLYPSSKILVLDDNSSDGTPTFVSEISQRNLLVSLIQREPEDKALSASIFEGILRCDTEFFVVMDADFQHPPKDVGRIYVALKEGNDLVIGARVDRQSLSPLRRFSSFAAQLLTHSYLWIHDQPSSRDIMTGFFGGRTELFQRVIEEHGELMDRRGFKALFDLLKFTPAGTKVAEVEFEFGTRMAGESKISSTVIMSILGQCGAPGRWASRFAWRSVELLYPCDESKGS